MQRSKTSDLPKSRAEARAAGLLHFFTGLACKRGHVSRRAMSGNCMACQAEDRAAKRDPVARKAYYIENRERERATNRVYLEANKVEVARKARLARERDRQRLAQKNAEWRAVNPDYVALHRAANPGLYRVYKQNRRAREATGKLSNDIVDRLLLLQRGKCACCARPLGGGFHLDHIKALSRGGTNEDGNVQLLRAKCNIAKGARDPIEFMQSFGKLL